MNLLLNSSNRLLKRFNLKIQNIDTPARISKSDLNQVDTTFQASRDPIYLVYQMGKVGSSSIHDCLFNSGKKSFHICHLSELTSRQLKFAIRDDYCPSLFSEKTMSAIASNEFLRFRVALTARSSPKRIKIITLTRDPIAQLISTYFEGFEVLFKHYVLSTYGSVTAKTIIDHLNNLIRIYLEHFTTSENDADDFNRLGETYRQTDIRWFLHCCRWPLIWFDRELKDVLNIDVFSQNLERDFSSLNFSQDEIDVLLLKFECLPQTCETALRTFSGDDTLLLPKKNVSRKKSYGSLFQEVLSSIQIPEEFADIQYRHKYSTTFYTPDELEGFKQRWCTPNYA